MGNLLAESLVRDVPDFPRPGILFKDITPIVQNAPALKQTVELLGDYAKERNADAILGIEARGFIFGAPIAVDRGLGFIPLRKLGKLPHDRVTEQYDLEYGSNTVELHSDSISPGQRVLIIDDLLATGGTAAAAARLVERLGGVVAGFGFVIELGFLNGRQALGDYDVKALISYE